MLKFLIFVTNRCLYEHAPLVPHDSHNVQWIDGLQDLHLTQSSLHQDEHTSPANTSTRGERKRREEGRGEIYNYLIT